MSVPPKRAVEAMHEESDEFRMYVYKIRECTNLGSHEWPMCPFIHHREKGRRRDPRIYNYVAIPCPDYKIKGECWKGEECQFAHGEIEYWFHPAKYRTRRCTDHGSSSSSSCGRKFCFFAHSEMELRMETKYKRCGLGRPVKSGAAKGGLGVAFKNGN